MNEKISIIIPAYNIEQYLSTTLDSVLAQEYQNTEIIVVDDGSKDKTGLVLDSYAQKYSQIHAIHKKNGGVTSARLRGLQEATGQWITFVDGDDAIEPDMYERLMRNAIDYNADISHCGYRMVFPDGHINYYHNTGIILNQKGLQGCRDLLDGSMIEPGLWNKLYRKALFTDIENLMDTSVRINEDLLMNYYLFKQARQCVFEDFCGYHYVLRRGSAVTSKVNKHKLYDPLHVTRIIQEDCDVTLKNINYSRFIHQLVSGATISVAEQPDLIRPFRAECRKELRQNLKTDILKSNIGLKLKIMAIWVAVWPFSYSLVHRLYARITGIDKLYDLN